MPSPDATPYIDLTIYDKDPQTIYEDAETRLQTELPEWQPREGNTEVLLLENLAAQVAESVYTVNRLPNGIMEALLLLFGLDRDNGAGPIGNVIFNVVNTLGYTIAAGTEVRLLLAGGLEPIIFTTASDLVIPPGQNSGTVSAVGDRFTADANNIPPNTTVEVLDSIIFIETAVLAAITTGGRDPEDDTDYFTRGATRFARLSETLVLPQHFTAYALENVNVERATTLDNWDSSGGAPGDDPGHVTVAVYGNGTTLTSPQKTALQAEMEALAAVNLQVHVIDPTITTINVTATVKALKGYTQAQVQANVVQALTDYLDPQKWLWGTTVWRNELITMISTAEGVDYTVSLTTPAGDTNLTGYATLADAGTLTITVNL